MKKMKIVTLERLQRAVDKVMREFIAHGLWTPELDEIEVYLVPAGSPFGWMARDDGHIRIPALSLSRMGDWFTGKYQPLANILRHELLHSFAWAHPERVDNRQFYRAFGSRLDDEFYHNPYSDEAHVTKYAASGIEEDYCEVGMLYLRHGGKLPASLDTPIIRKKWAFFRSLCRRNRRLEGY